MTYVCTMKFRRKNQHIHNDAHFIGCAISKETTQRFYRVLPVFCSCFFSYSRILYCRINITWSDLRRWSISPRFFAHVCSDGCESTGGKEGCIRLNQFWLVLHWLMWIGHNFRFFIAISGDKINALQKMVLHDVLTSFAIMGSNI